MREIRRDGRLIGVLTLPEIKGHNGLRVAGYGVFRGFKGHSAPISRQGAGSVRTHLAAGPISPKKLDLS